MKNLQQVLYVVLAAILFSCQEIVIEGEQEKPSDDKILNIPASELKWVVLEGGEDPETDPNPEEDGDVGCLGSNGNCLPEVVITASATIATLIDAIDNDETDVFFL